MYTMTMICASSYIGAGGGSKTKVAFEFGGSMSITRLGGWPFFICRGMVRCFWACCVRYSALI